VLAWGWIVAVSAVSALVVAVIAATIAFPVLSEMQTAERLGFIWQGRYTLPIGVGIPILAAWVVGTRMRPSGVLRAGAAVLAVGVAVGNLAGWATMMTRYHTGSSAPITSYFRWSNTWHAPLGNVVTTALLVAALGALAVLLAAGAWWRPDPDDAPSTTSSRGRTTVGAARGG
jgi:hypothetical protein